MDLRIPSSTSSTGQVTFLEGIEVKRSTALFSALANGTSSNDDTKQQVRPPFTYLKLILQALKSSPDCKMTSSGIIAFIKQRYPYYRNIPSRTWQSQLHQVLRSKTFFRKILREDGDKGPGCYWQLDAASKDYIDCAFELGRGPGGRLSNLNYIQHKVVTAMNGENVVESVVPSTSETVQELSAVLVGPPPAKLQKSAEKPSKSANKPVLKQSTVGVRRGRGTWQRKRPANFQYIQNSNIANEDEPVQNGDLIEGNSASSNSGNVMGLSSGSENDSQTEMVRYLLFQFALEDAIKWEYLRAVVDIYLESVFPNGNPYANNPPNKSQIALELLFGNTNNPASNSQIPLYLSSGNANSIAQLSLLSAKLKLQVEAICWAYGQWHAQYTKK